MNEKPLFGLALPYRVHYYIEENEISGLFHVVCPFVSSFDLRMKVTAYKKKGDFLLKQRKIKTADLTVMAFFIALEFILTRFCSINTPFLRIGFGFLPVSIIGIMYGPLWAGACYAAGDLLGMVFFPTGPYFPGFTLTALLTGVTYGVILHEKRITWKRALLSAAIVCGILNLCLDTYWLVILYERGIAALLPGRLVKTAVMIPVQTLLIPLVWKRCAATLSGITNNRFI